MAILIENKSKSKHYPKAANMETLKKGYRQVQTKMAAKFSSNWTRLACHAAIFPKDTNLPHKRPQRTGLTLTQVNVLNDGHNSSIVAGFWSAIVQGNRKIDNWHYS